ncbi:MAG: hypothetical protein Fur0022_22820 [Anaerolineales bacterium]
MTPKRYSVKFFIENPAAVHLPAFIPIFHRWIQTRAVEGLLIDVADYKHVHNGPGILLIGYEGDYALDTNGGRPGLRYIRKRETPASLEDGLREAFRLARNACQTLENDLALGGEIHFNPAEIELTFLDRLNTPNTPETFHALQSTISNALSAHFPDGNFTLEPDFSDPRRPLIIRINTIPESLTLAS